MGKETLNHTHLQNVDDNTIDWMSKKKLYNYFYTPF